VVLRRHEADDPLHRQFTIDRMEPVDGALENISAPDLLEGMHNRSRT
jgi:hypothetical protein